MTFFQGGPGVDLVLELRGVYSKIFLLGGYTPYPLFPTPANNIKGIL